MIAFVLEAAAFGGILAWVARRGRGRGSVPRRVQGVARRVDRRCRAGRRAGVRGLSRSIPVRGADREPVHGRGGVRVGALGAVRRAGVCDRPRRAEARGAVKAAVSRREDLRSVRLERGSYGATSANRSPSSTSGKTRRILQTGERGPTCPENLAPAKQIVAFKVEPELAALLDAMPNKSEFIRAAVHSRLSSACPLCRGTGVAPFGGVSATSSPSSSSSTRSACAAGCGAEGASPLPLARPLRGGAAARRVRALGCLLLRGLRPQRRSARRAPSPSGG